jgi:D-beta-D-heptose 7-phosphate kinase/D-beta-D-heptose 1-phosphate adenosyltransferase
MEISFARFKRIVGRFAGRRVAIVGDWMLDRYIWGTASRLSPEAPVPVVEFAREEAVLGGAGNVAANLSALGARVVPFGLVGEDEFAGQLLACLRAQGLPDKNLLRDPQRKTTVKTRLVAGHQQVVRVDRETRAAISGELEEQLIRKIVGALRSVQSLVISDYEKGTVTEELTARVLAACQKLGVLAFVKPKWSMLPKYPGAAAVVLNRKEASFLVTRPLDGDAEVEEAARALLEKFACPAVVITRGEHGMSVFEQGDRRALHIPAASRDLPHGRLGLSSHRAAGREVFDVTGAGDTVLATLAVAMAAGASVRDAALLANEAAGVVVGKLGTATLTREELLASLRRLR